MTYESLQKYCLSKPGSVKEYPFDRYVVVYKVGSKIFALSKDGENPIQINFKCDPVYSLELRSIYKSVTAGYHMNKKHWNTVSCDGEVDDESIYTWIDDSYELVFNKLSKKEKARILH